MKKQLQARISRVEEALKKVLIVKDNPQKQIYEAMEYSLMAGGKRLRPILMMEACVLCGGTEEMAMPFACAMEMIHTYSLIHDDLPAMDNDDLRRGRPTSHIKFGEGMAILAGDALLTKAFELVCAYEFPGVPPQRVLQAASLLARSAGTEGMIGGQVVDIEKEGQKITLEELQYLHAHKTGAIIRSSCAIGAVLAGAAGDQIRAVDGFAANLGIAFQIQDDILDVTGTEAELGKPIGSDKDSGKNTYVTLCGLEGAQGLMREYSEKAVSALELFGEKAAFLKGLTRYLITRKA